MFQTIRNAWAVPETRKKLLYTLMIIVIFRIGSAIPVPFLDPAALKAMIDTNNLGFLDIMTGGSFAQATIFAMSIMPYINASIIIQLLTVAIPPLERMAKEGDTGRKKIAKITRYVTFALALVMAIMYYFLMVNVGAITSEHRTGFAGFFVAAIIVVTFVAGTAVIVWLGERINEKGIGNGISIILFAGIISRGPAMISTAIQYLQLGNPLYYVLIPLIVVIFIAMIAFIVVMTNAERRIPVQYAKRVVGRKMYGGQNSHIPIKVSMSGVMPIIFASSFVSIPGTIAAFFKPEDGTFWKGFVDVFSYTSIWYGIIYFLLIIAFNYFYVAIQYNPVEIANNLRKNSGAIPGIRPGKPTSDFISKVLSKITFVGAIFLGIVAIFPIIFTNISGINIAIGGTSILIVVGVALETMRTLESQITMRHHKGFLE
ncbi:MAG: preprotein translocase subunit SecY [Oscillospiraceae bacterium]|jgi:preprotein translocase subunit SecY